MEKMYLRTNKLLSNWVAALSLILCLSMVNFAQAQINLAPNSSFATCNIAADGTATVTPTGGVEPYSYNWSTGSTSFMIFNLLPGDYQVTVTDAVGTTAVQTVTVMIGPEGIWLMPTSIAASCGACDGQAFANAMLGAPPYTYLWSDGQTTEPAVGLCPGEISVTVTDSQGCSNSDSVIVGINGNLNVATTSTDAGCLANMGTATATPSGGIAPFTYTWTGPNGFVGNTQTITDLVPGTYNVTVVSDFNGCTGIATVQVTGMATDLAVTTTSTPTDCGTTDGTATANPTGGQLPYTYLWSNGAVTQTITNLAPGVFTVTVTDGRGCTATSTVEVAGSTAPDAGTISTMDGTTICAGDGVPDPITFDVTGNTMGADISTQWIVTDANGVILALPPTNVIDLEGAGPGTCLIFFLVYENIISGLEVGNNASDIAGCFDLSNNIPVIRLSTEPSTISTQDPLEFCVGDMEDDFVDVTIDEQGVGTNCTFVITDANDMILGLPMMPPFNFEDTGSGSCNIYYLNYNDGLPFTGLEVGESLDDVEGCFSLSNPITVIRNDVGTVTITPENLTICPGEELILTGMSTENSTFEWFASEGILGTPNEAVTTYTNMEPGTYMIILSTTTDAGCMGMASTTVTVLDGPVVNIVDDPNGNIICNEGETLDITVENPTAGVTYVFTASAGMITSNGPNATFSYNQPGVATITVEATDDVTGCSTTSTTTSITGIFDIDIAVTSPLTKGGDDGELTVTPNGGNGDFTYEWSNGVTTAVNSGLSAGIFTVTVTDVLSGCTQEGSFEIEPAGLSIGNFVFTDSNQNCIQDGAESGLEGVPVNLVTPGPDGIPCNADDVIAATTDTDENGLYLFECVEPGTYYIQFFATVVFNGLQYTCIDGDGSGSSVGAFDNDDDIDSDADEDGKTMPFEILDVDGDGIPETIDMNGDGINDKNPLSFDAGVFEICDNVNSGGEISGTQTIKAGQIPAKLMSVTPAGGGGTAPIEYLWICSTTGGTPSPTTYENVPNSNTECLQPGPVFQTKFFARCARREGCPDFVIESNVIVVEVTTCAQIVTFTTNMMNDASVQVSWITDDDTPNGTYHVERSIDGANFEVLAEIPSKFGALSAYSFNDSNPEKGMNYYRVKRIDEFGEYYFTDISEEMIIVSAKANFDIFPNPVSTNLKLENLALIEGDVQVDIISTSGVTKNTMKMDASSYNTSSIDTNNLPAGVYYLRITHEDGQVDLIKFTKVN